MTEITFKSNRLTLYPSKYDKNACDMIANGDILNADGPN